MDENLKPMYDGILNNRKNWQRLSEEREKKSTEEGCKALAGNGKLKN